MDVEKWWMAGILLLWWIGLPFSGGDVGDFIVVETLLVEQKGAETLVYTESLQGQGESLEAALKDMEERAPGTLFLRQTQRILLCGEDTWQLDLRQAPEELPLGAAIYRETESAAVLQGELAQKAAELEAQEARGASVRTLAEEENAQWKEKA